MLLNYKSPIRLSLIISLIILSFSLTAQIPTTRAIFDYNIGDEFHARGQNYNEPPQASRHKIIGKWFSQNSDTVFYKIQHNDYTSTFVPYPDPHLEYVFYNYTDTVAYTDLDSTVLYYLTKRSDLSNYTLINYTYDTISRYCQNQLHKFTFSTGGFEPDMSVFHLSKGLGYLYYNHISTSAITPVDFQSFNIYYRKTNKTCGTADTVGLAIETINPNSVISIFPNPATETVYIQMPDKQAYQLEIYDMNSKLVFQKDFNEKVLIFNVSIYSKGVYIIKVHNNANSYSSKFIVE